MNFYISPFWVALLGLSLFPIFLLIQNSLSPSWFNIKLPISQGELMTGSLLFVSYLFLIFRPVYTETTPSALSLQYLQNDSDKAKLLVGEKNRRIPNILKDKLTENSSLIIEKSIPWSDNEYQRFDIDSQFVEGAELTVLSSEKTKTGRVVKVSINTNRMFLSDLKLFFPLESKLKTINTGENIINYNEDRLTNRIAYGFHCVGQICEKKELALTFNTYEPVSVRLILVSKGLPKHIEKYQKLRGKTAVEKGRGDRSIVSSQVVI